MSGAGQRPDAGSRSPYGERGLKSRQRPPQTPHVGRSPYGERGLKFNVNA